MKTYRVTWEIDLDIDDVPEGASYRDIAAEALRIQRDPDSLATVFAVREYLEDGRVCSGADIVTIDLSEEDSE